jgi:hypothetical protein
MNTLPITNAEFDIQEVDASAPDWRTASPSLDFWFEMKGTPYSFHVQWPSQEQISEAVSLLSADERGHQLEPHMSFLHAYSVLSALQVIQPMMAEILETKPSEPDTFARILANYGFLDNARHFISTCE